jgi:hypothetical protein
MVNLALIRLNLEGRRARRKVRHRAFDAPIPSSRNEREGLGLNHPAANTLFGSSVFNAFCDKVTAATGGLRPPNRGLRETDGPSA